MQWWEIFVSRIDGTNYYFTIREDLAEYKIEEVRWIYGTEDHVRNALLGLFFCGAQNPTQVDQTTFHNPGQDSVSLTVPFSAVQGDCIYFHAHIKVVKRDPVTGQEYYSFWIWNNGPLNASQNQCQRYFKYCKQNCPPVVCKPIRTFTQGGWGSKPHGHNPGTYLHAKFAGAFPTGLTVGCATGYRVRFSNAWAITNYLPAGGKPSVLNANHNNPSTWWLKNVLVSQLTALTLNVGFDLYDPNFSPSGVNLGDMIIASGPFQGKSVKEFLVIANDVLGGCSNAYTPSQVNETATRINEGCKDGRDDEHDDDDDDDDDNRRTSSPNTGDHGDNRCEFLRCPGGGGPVKSTNSYLIQGCCEKQPFFFSGEKLNRKIRNFLPSYFFIPTNYTSAWFL